MQINSINNSKNYYQPNFRAYLDKGVLKNFRKELPNYNIDFIKDSISTIKSANNAVKNLGCKNTKITISDEVVSDSMRIGNIHKDYKEVSMIISSPFFDSTYKIPVRKDCFFHDWAYLASNGLKYFTDNRIGKEEMDRIETSILKTEARRKNKKLCRDFIEELKYSKYMDKDSYRHWMRIADNIDDARTAVEKNKIFEDFDEYLNKI